MNKQDLILESLHKIHEEIDSNDVIKYTIALLKSTKIKARDIKYLEPKVDGDKFEVSISCLVQRSTIDKMFRILVNSVVSKFRMTDGIGLYIDRGDIEDDMQRITVRIDNK